MITSKLVNVDITEIEIFHGLSSTGFFTGLNWKKTEGNSDCVIYSKRKANTSLQPAICINFTSTTTSRIKLSAPLNLDQTDAKYPFGMEPEPRNCMGTTFQTKTQQNSRTYASSPKIRGFLNKTNRIGHFHSRCCKSV